VAWRDDPESGASARAQTASADASKSGFCGDQLRDGVSVKVRRMTRVIAAFRGS
jgi:hypothetical protein